MKWCSKRSLNVSATTKILKRLTAYDNLVLYPYDFVCYYGLQVYSLSFIYLSISLSTLSSNINVTEKLLSDCNGVLLQNIWSSKDEVLNENKNWLIRSSFVIPVYLYSVLSMLKLSTESWLSGAVKCILISYYEIMNAWYLSVVVNIYFCQLCNRMSGENCFHLVNNAYNFARRSSCYQGCRKYEEVSSKYPNLFWKVSTHNVISWLTTNSVIISLITLILIQWPFMIKMDNIDDVINY